MISKNEVKHIAGLVRIGVREKEVENFSKDLSSILDWMKDLEKVNITGVEPMAHTTGLENKVREDRQKDFENKKGIVQLFPEDKNGYDKVKSVL